MGIAGCSGMVMVRSFRGAFRMYVHHQNKRWTDRFMSSIRMDLDEMSPVAWLVLGGIHLVAWLHAFTHPQ